MDAVGFFGFFARKDAEREAEQGVFSPGIRGLELGV